MDEYKIKSELEKNRNNFETQRAGLRQCLSISFLSSIKKPSYESCMAAIRADVYIVKFKSYCRGNIRKYLEWDEEINNSLHILYHYPEATFIWDIIRDVIKIMLGKSIRIDIRAALINFYNIKE